MTEHERTNQMSTVPLREYVEAVLREHQVATDTAEREREKAATALATQLEQRIRDGDDRLHEHIANQIMQIRAALESAEKLEVQRLEAALQRVAAVQRELELQYTASETAIAKAERATEERFQSLNALREQIALERATYLPREVAEAQFAEMRRTLSELAEKVGKI